MSIRNLLSTTTASLAGIIEKTTKVVEINLDSVEKLSLAGNHAAGEVEREAKLSYDKAMHRLEKQEAEFLRDLEAIDVQL